MTRSIAPRAIIVLAACCVAGASPCVAFGATLERMEFPAAASRSSERTQGEVGNSSDRLQGYLAKPEGEGPHPAIVALHGCGGPERKRMQGVADALVSWGYVVLFVDSFSTRGIYHLCTPDKYAAEMATVANRPADALSALRFLAAQPFVDSRRTAVVGFSQGAETALTIAETASPEAIANAASPVFRAAVAFYPPCRRAGGRPAIPTLIPIGALDDWTPAEDCTRLVADWGGAGVAVELVVYAGAYHGFDASVFSPGSNIFGHWVEYNPQAAENAYRKMQDFLERHLGR